MCILKNDYNWSGRIDSLTDKSAFRWHQIVKKIDLNELNFLKNPSVIILGFSSDEGVKRNKGRIGAAKAPDKIRSYLSSLAWHYDDFELYDAGNIIAGDNLEKAQSLLSESIKKIKEIDAFPIIIGGGHEVAYGSFNGLDKDTSIINFDAHFDNRPYDENISSGTMFAQIADELKESYKYLCLGIQKSSNTKQLFERNNSFGGDFVFAEDFFDNQESLDEKLENFINHSKQIYLTLCMDVFASNVAPGVSSPTPFGILPYQFLKYLKKIIKTQKLTSFDIAEVNPEYDINDMTSKLASQIIFHVVDNIYTWGFK
jgi:formiminoglutamase